MTLLDLIRTLHADGKPVVSYDLFICDNSMMLPEEAVSVGFDDSTVRIGSPYIPPQYIDLGDSPSYVYVEDAKTYKRLTNMAGKVPLRYPRLLVVVFSDRSEGFYQRYLGKSWRDIPPMEIEWANSDGLLLPLLDASGIVTGFSYDGFSGVDTGATFYRVRSEWGTEFAWQGDLTRDHLPAGLRIVSE